VFCAFAPAGGWCADAVGGTVNERGRDGLTRRQIIGRGGVLAGALGAGPMNLLAPAPAAAAELPGHQRATYVALVEAVGSVPGTGVDATGADAAATRLAELVAQMGTDGGSHVEHVLTALDDADPAQRFADKSVAERVRLLRSWERSGEMGEITMASYATSLAARPAYPYPPDHPQPAITLGGAR
jgi:hypothetical protein